MVIQFCAFASDCIVLRTNCRWKHWFFAFCHAFCSEKSMQNRMKYDACTTMVFKKNAHANLGSTWPPNRPHINPQLDPWFYPNLTPNFSSTFSYFCDYHAISDVKNYHAVFSQMTMMQASSQQKSNFSLRWGPFCYFFTKKAVKIFKSPGGAFKSRRNLLRHPPKVTPKVTPTWTPQNRAQFASTFSKKKRYYAAVFAKKRQNWPPPNLTPKFTSISRNFTTRIYKIWQTIKIRW